MLINTNSTNVTATPKLSDTSSIDTLHTQAVVNSLLQELQQAVKLKPASSQSVMTRIALEVDRICSKSKRIQDSGEVGTWQLNLARHRLQKCLQYYRLGSRQGRVELHSNLAAMVYRHVAPFNSNLHFQARYNLIEDFLQGFYIESLRAFRREHEVNEDYTPQTRLELSEYMAFTEQYAKRQIGLPGRNRQRLIVLRAQGFAKGQPPEMSLDIELAVEGGKTEEAEAQSRSHAMQQIREQMVSEMVDPADAVLRDRVIAELVQYLEAQGQNDCVDYLVLKLQDWQACDIDQALNLTPRQRDYLQQRFKYHVEKFANSNNWKLVHEWLGADLDQKLGMTTDQWQVFQDNLSLADRTLLQLKGDGQTDKAIAAVLKCTPKQLQKRWSKLLNQAASYRKSEASA